MKIAVYEDNLIWSARLDKSIRALGHEAVILSNLEVPEGIERAIVNLSSPTIDPRPLVEMLKSASIPIIAHAGHKETALRELGLDLGVDQLVSNSQLTFKLAEILGPAN